MRPIHWLVPCLISATFAACGGGQKSAEAPTGEVAQAATPSDVAAPAEKAWKDMNREERMEFMGLTVMPAMQELFVAFDPEGYRDFKCQTCHGADMKEVDFKMPNGLYALPAEDPITAAKEYDEKTTTFMMESVVPNMATLLGEKPGIELRCTSCHATEE